MAAFCRDFGIWEKVLSNNTWNSDYTNNEQFMQFIIKIDEKGLI